MKGGIGVTSLALVITGLLVLAGCGGSVPETVEFTLDIRERELEEDIDGVSG